MVVDIRTDEKIKIWFSNREFAAKTKETYAVYMQLFCDCINKTPSEIVLEANLETKSGLLLNQRKAVEYFAAFKDCLTKKGFSDKTHGLAISAVTSFFQFNDIQLSSQIGRNRDRLPQKENQRFLEKEDIKKILTNARTLRDKAIVLFIATSGIARCEIQNLKIKYLNLNDPSGIGILDIRRKKVHRDYITFITPEAVEAVKDYFEERNRTPEIKIKGPNDYVFVTYRSGYRFQAGSRLSDREFSSIFHSIGEELGYKNDAGWMDCRSHVLRKDFSSTLEDAGVPYNTIEYLMGHARKGVDRAYYRKNINELKELYISRIEYLGINREQVARSMETVDTKKVKQLETDKEMIELKLLEKDREIQNLQKQIAERDHKVDVLSKQASQFESKFAHMEDLEKRLSLMERVATGEKDIADIKKETNLFFLKKRAVKK